MSYHAIRLLLVSLNFVFVLNASASYLGCFQDYHLSSTGITENQYSNGRDIQFIAYYGNNLMTNDLCIDKCTSYGTFLYAATQYGYFTFK